MEIRRKPSSSDIVYQIPGLKLEHIEIRLAALKGFLKDLSTYPIKSGIGLKRVMLVGEFTACRTSSCKLKPRLLTLY